jgi:hypothetical protein
VSSQNQDELQRKVEEVKQDADVQRALQQATATEKTEAPVARARGRDKVWIGTQVFCCSFSGLCTSSFDIACRSSLIRWFLNSSSELALL